MQSWPTSLFCGRNWCDRGLGGYQPGECKLVRHLMSGTIGYGLVTARSTPVVVVTNT